MAGANAGTGRNTVELTNFGPSGQGPLAPPTLPVVFGRGGGSASSSFSASSAYASASVTYSSLPSSRSASSADGSYIVRASAWSARTHPGAYLPSAGSTSQQARVQQQQHLPPVAASQRAVTPEVRLTSPQFSSAIKAVLRGLGPGEADKRLAATRGVERSNIAAAAAAAMAKEASVRPAKPFPIMSEREREEQAKARRLARFSPSGTSEGSMGTASQTIFADKAKPRAASQQPEMKKLAATKDRGVVRGLKRHGNSEEAAQPRPREQTPDGAAEFDASDSFADERDWNMAEPILGSCPDMCPESERQERERKGDLDRFERLDGEKNQTTKNLALKKYTRTAEREPSLIRPLPVLQITMDHLLGLLERPYDEDLLGLYNFLWDRMRAIRMDLRMQHVFNTEAITMHERMIRFHILAMHELCDYSNGAGPVEGFNGHLNIEQMNKTSVDLFQMYEDHRRKGTPVPTEAEFRGYYALLKLDKHPGHFVEPAELSMDLAQMNGAMRSTSEVRFARDVARSCRTGNYIAFFRLARTATYLQACLMHAHFSKLRTHALASLHSGLQKNQGIPVAQVAEWLGMEGEDIGELLSYHGFNVKHFEENYMVKEGPFLNNEGNYPTRRSQLVILKCSRMVADDVKSQGRAMEIKSSSTRALAAASEKIGGLATFWRGGQNGGFVVPEEEMPDYEDEEQHNEELVSYRDSKMQDDGILYTDLDNLESEPELSHVSFNHGIGNRQHHEVIVEHQNEPPSLRKRKMDSELECEEPDAYKHLRRGESFKMQESVIADKVLQKVSEVTELPVNWAIDGDINAIAPLQEDEDAQSLHIEEAVIGRERLWFRRWRQRTSASVQDKNLKKKRADIALRQLALGPPLRQISRLFTKENSPNAEDSDTFSEFDLNEIIKKRNININKMWMELDVPSLVAKILKDKNPEATGLCWKLAVCSRLDDKNVKVENYLEKLACEWLKFKLFKDTEPLKNFQKCVHHWLETSLPRNVLGCQLGSKSGGKIPLCCIIREIGFFNTEPQDATGTYGASGLLFLLLSSLPIAEESARLHSVVESVPSGSRVPLLILVTQSPFQQESIVAHSLELEKLDNSKVGCWLILCITKPKELSTESTCGRGFYEDLTVIEGLQWLASNAPAAPNVQAVHIQDLVLEHLEPNLRLLMAMHPSNVTPEICISIFNQSLENAMNDIEVSASTGIPHWPPPDIRDLSEGAKKDLLCDCLPRQGWNKHVTLQPIFDALQCSMLPPFPNLSLSQCSKPESTSFSPLTSKMYSKEGIIYEISSKKLLILNSFLQYLGQLGEMEEGIWPTGHQVQRILEKSCVLNWTDTGCDVIPKWVYLFEIIYQTRLVLLNGYPEPVVYVSRRNAATPKLDEYATSLCLAQRLSDGSPSLCSLRPSIVA